MVGLLLYASYGADEKSRIFGLVAAGGFVAGWHVWNFAWKPVTDHQLTLRYRLFPVIFGFIERVQYSHGYEPAFLRDINEIKLVRFTSSENDDLLTGVHEGLDFEMIESKLNLGSGKNKETVFSGLILRFRLDRPFPGQLLAAKRSGWLERTWNEMWRVEPSDELLSGNRRLDESHAFRSDNPAAARPVIAGPLTSLLTWLANEWHAGGDVRIALCNDICFLLLPSGRDYFALPGISNDVDYRADIEPMIRDMTMLLAVAHLLKKIG